MAAVLEYPTRTRMVEGLTEIARQIGASLTPQLSASLPTTPLEMYDLERDFRQAGLAQADLHTARAVLGAHLKPDFVKAVTTQARQAYRAQGGHLRLRNKGWRTLTLTLRGGTQFTLATPYLRPDLSGRPGRRRTKRREGGAGVYPVLAALGLTDRITPAAREAIARETVVQDSYSEATEQLARDGLVLRRGTLADHARRLADTALALRDADLARAREQPLPTTSPLAGRVVQVSIDGGRSRVRETQHRRQVGDNGRRPFELGWREPRVITVTVLDEKGEQDRVVKPFYEVSLGNADAVFALLEGLLRRLGVHLASKVVFISDGAPWIWCRLDGLVKAVGLPAERVTKVLDFWHACEHVMEALKACRNLKEPSRTAVYERLRHQLRHSAGGAASVVAELKSLARGRRSKAVKEALKTLEDHVAHMDYVAYETAGLPLGSGVVESAVRRVINQRFKSASLAWRVEQLEALLYLRAVVKSGRWESAVRAWLRGEHWLEPVMKAAKSKAQAEKRAG